MNNKRPVLIIISPGFAASKEDSTCLPLQQNLIKAINKKFSSLKIIILAFQYPYAASEYNWNGNKIISFGGENKGKIFRLLLWRRVSLQLKRLYKEENI